MVHPMLYICTRNQKKSRTKNDNAMEGLFIFFLVATSVGSLLNDYVNEAKKVKGER